jgi:hypothetical protein
MGADLLTALGVLLTDPRALAHFRQDRSGFARSRGLSPEETRILAGLDLAELDRAASASRRKKRDRLRNTYPSLACAAGVLFPGQPPVEMHPLLEAVASRQGIDAVADAVRGMVTLLRPGCGPCLEELARYDGARAALLASADASRDAAAPRVTAQEVARSDAGRVRLGRHVRTVSLRADVPALLDGLAAGVMRCAVTDTCLLLMLQPDRTVRRIAISPAAGRYVRQLSESTGASSRELARDAGRSSFAHASEMFTSLLAAGCFLRAR